MADTPHDPPADFTCTGVAAPRISEEQARETAREWLDSQGYPSVQKHGYRFGRAVMVYYPFWCYYREDGLENKIIYRPACGTLMTGLQSLRRTTDEFIPVPEDASILPATINAGVYQHDLHGIPRGEKLIAIPFWLISYKIQNSIYMLKIDAETGAVMPEWHPIKEPVNWKKTALIAFIPVCLISLIAIYIHPALFIFAAGIIIFLLYQSEMIGVLNLKRREGKNGS
ncbi:MAG: hypothetical protein Q4Q04_02890 [Methanocorpusculum sp.]|nr:hypothetical protein [Methanocorpusculum sp.]